ncbi:MAG: DUF6198 family protein [Clostridiales bacterium]|nr:DUF6198 family protein [Clostridiales bacterium]HBM81879.1 hypothetical protein [Clostridiaceae bacterium]
MKTKIVRKRLFPCEAALTAAILLNSLTLCLLVKSSFGISTLSSVPLALSKIFTSISLGTWTTVIQTATVLLLIFITKQPRIGYFFSFLVAIIFGFFVDIDTHMMLSWSLLLPWKICYFLIGFIGMAFGASLFIKCRLPITPFDLFVRDLSRYSGKNIKLVKTTYDFICVALTITLSLSFLHKIVGIGIGTILGMIFTGTITQFFVKKLDSYFIFVPVTKTGKFLVKITEISKKS